MRAEATRSSVIASDATFSLCGLVGFDAGGAFQDLLLHCLQVSARSLLLKMNRNFGVGFLAALDYHFHALISGQIILVLLGNGEKLVDSLVDAPKLALLLKVSRA